MFKLKPSAGGRGRGRGGRGRGRGGRGASLYGNMPSGPRPNKKTRAELRILNEIAKGECELDEKCFLLFTPEKKSYLKLKLVVTPPTGLWEGVPFGFELTFSTEAPNDYPNQQPKVRLMDGYKIYHPNIDLNGKVCLGLRKGVWRAALGGQVYRHGPADHSARPEPGRPAQPRSLQTASRRPGPV